MTDSKDFEIYERCSLFFRPRRSLQVPRPVESWEGSAIYGECAAIAEALSNDSERARLTVLDRLYRYGLPAKAACELAAHVVANHVKHGETS